MSDDDLRLVRGAPIATDDELIALAGRLPVPRLSESRRRALAAEVLTLADVEPPSPRLRGRYVVAVAIAAAAAAVLLAIGLRPRSTSSPRFALAVSGEPVALRERLTVREEVVAVAAATTTPLAAAREVVQLRDGELTLDTREREPVTVVAGDTTVTIDEARATVVARGGVIVTAHVFAGSAEVTARGKRHVIEAGEVWLTSETGAGASAEASLAAFRTGWAALRAERYTDAIAAFDRATDPVVVEDAAFWAAIAAERAGDLGAAKRRLEAFSTTFPGSPRLDAARAALARLAAAALAPSR